MFTLSLLCEIPIRNFVRLHFNLCSHFLQFVKFQFLIVSPFKYMLIFFFPFCFVLHPQIYHFCWVSFLKEETMLQLLRVFSGSHILTSVHKELMWIVCKVLVDNVECMITYPIVFHFVPKGICTSSTDVLRMVFVMAPFQYSQWFYVSIPISYIPRVPNYVIVSPCS
jgi:hypothetical protein